MNVCQKIKKLFYEYGIEFSEEEIQAKLNEANMILGSTNTKEEYGDLFVKSIIFVRNVIEINDYSKFSKKIGVEKSIKEIPEWFGEGIELIYNVENKCLTVSTTIADVLFRFSNPFREKCYKLFEKVVEPELRTEIKLKKIFEPDSAVVFLQEWTNKKFAAIQKFVEDENALVDLSVQIRNIASEEFKSLKMYQMKRKP